MTAISTMQFEQRFTLKMELKIYNFKKRIIVKNIILIKSKNGIQIQKRCSFESGSMEKVGRIQIRICSECWFADRNTKI